MDSSVVGTVNGSDAIQQTLVSAIKNIIVDMASKIWVLILNKGVYKQPTIDIRTNRTTTTKSVPIDNF